MSSTKESSFTPSQFRQLECNFLEEFQLKTPDFYHQDANKSNFIQYHKIINQLNIRKKQMNFKKQKFITTLNPLTTELQFLKKSSLSKQSTMNLKNITNTIGQNDDNDDHQSCLYLTQMPVKQPLKQQQQQQRQQSENSKSGNFKLSKCRTYGYANYNETSDQFQSRCSRNMMTSSFQWRKTTENSETMSVQEIQDKIHGQNSILSCLKHQENQVQEAIFCFKKRIIRLQQDLSNEYIKSKEVDKLLIGNKNQMISVKHTKDQVKSACLKTIKHFDLDFEGKQNIHDKISADNKQQFHESIADNIKMKKMKSKIVRQNNQLQALQNKYLEISKNGQRHEQIYTKQKQFIQIFQYFFVYSRVIKSIPDNESIQNNESNQKVAMTGKRFFSYQEQKADNQQSLQNNVRSRKSTSSKKPIVSKCLSLESEEPLFSPNRSKTLHKIIQCQDSEQHIYPQITSSEIVKDLVKLHRELVKSVNTETSKFEILIHERDELERYQMHLHSCIQKNKQENSLKKESIMLTRAQKRNERQKQQVMDEESGINHENILFVDDTQSINRKIARNNLFINCLTDKLRFFTTKHFLIYKMITENWVKNDKQALLKSQAMETKLNSVFEKMQLQDLDFAGSMQALVSSFQRWTQYAQYLNLIQTNPFLKTYFNKNRLLSLFKRIIKTKTKHQNIPTCLIFEKSILLAFDNKLGQYSDNVKAILSFCLQMHRYIFECASGKLYLDIAPKFQFLQNTTDISETGNAANDSRPSCSESSEVVTLIGRQIKNSNESKKSSHHEKNGRLSKNQQQSQYDIQQMKKKLIKGDNTMPVLNIHEFYQDLRGQIEKIKIKNW